jgi:copper chaperone NosL
LEPAAGRRYTTDNALEDEMKVKDIMLSWSIIVLFVLQAGAGERGFMKPGATEKCPVCGMFVAKYPDWTSEVIFRDGGHAVFDGPKDLFKFLTNMKEYAPARTAADIDKVFVNDYYAVTPIDGRFAFYVLGSDATGPMGRELVPFAKETDAREFLRDHRGKKVLRFEEVTPSVLKELD